MDRELAPERTWVTTVRDKLLVKAEGMTGVGKYRLSEFIKSNITPIVEGETEISSP